MTGWAAPPSSLRARELSAILFPPAEGTLLVALVSTSSLVLDALVSGTASRTVRPLLFNGDHPRTMFRLMVRRKLRGSPNRAKPVQKFLYRLPPLLHVLRMTSFDRAAPAAPSWAVLPLVHARVHVEGLHRAGLAWPLGVRCLDVHLGPSDCMRQVSMAR